jgi:hypothetical protein
MPSPRWPVENRLLVRASRLARAGQQLATATRKAEDAARIADMARQEAIRAIVDAAPLLTAEQREQLRPILAGTIPADTGRADSPAA